jgi:hypothetical protein
VNDRKLSGQTPHSILGSAAPKSGGEGVPHPLAIFVMQRNGPSGVAKLNGATTRVIEQRKPTGETRQPGMTKLIPFKSGTGDDSVCFARPLPMYSTTKSIQRGAQIYSI